LSGSCKICSYCYGRDTVVVCNPVLVTDTIDLQLSLLVSDFEIVCLENSDEAIIGDGDNYIGTYSYEDGSYKLFDRKGKYLGVITSRGQGLNEFTVGIYDSYIDECGWEIYILPIRTSKILVFDLQGNPLGSIPLPFMLHKGQIKINVKEQILTC